MYVRVCVCVCVFICVCVFARMPTVRQQDHVLCPRPLLCCDQVAVHEHMDTAYVCDRCYPNVSA